MYHVHKDGRTVAVRDENQLAAFLNNGWTQKKADTPTASEKPVVKEETEITKEDIMGMQYFSLKAFAKKNGVEVKKGMTIDVVQKAVIEKLGL